VIFQSSRIIGQPGGVTVFVGHGNGQAPAVVCNLPCSTVFPDNPYPVAVGVVGKFPGLSQGVGAGGDVVHGVVGE